MSRLYSPSVITISASRLASRIDALARFGGLPGGGVTRPCWSPQHEEARAWLMGEMRAAGLETRVDGAGYDRTIVTSVSSAALRLHWNVSESSMYPSLSSSAGGSVSWSFGSIPRTR